MHGRQNRLRNSCATEKRPALRNKEAGAKRLLGEARRGLLQSAATMEEEQMSEQNFENHGKFLPSYHFFAVPVFLINFLWSLYRLKKLGISFQGIFGVILAAAFVVLVFQARLFALAVQDRAIRLEERLRYERVLPADLQARAGELSIGQIVALRFASDEELPQLMRKVLDEKLTERKAIKQLVKNWKPDYLRA